MPESDLSARLRSVERALTDGDTIPDLTDAADTEQRLDALEAEVETLTDRVDALDATVQSLHGYVGDLEHVNDRVERRADAARAAVERLEGRRAPPQSSDEQFDEPGETTNSASTATVSSCWDGDEVTRDRVTQDDDDETLFGRVRDAL